MKVEHKKPVQIGNKFYCYEGYKQGAKQKIIIEGGTPFSAVSAV
jgi:hypothetical protein